MSDRIPPQSNEAEQAVLGSMLYDETGAAVAEVSHILTVADFYRKDHQILFDALTALGDFLKTHQRRRSRNRRGAHHA